MYACVCTYAISLYTFKHVYRLTYTSLYIGRHLYMINIFMPQGSILGPTLFNCYVSTLVEIIPENGEKLHVWIC